MENIGLLPPEYEAELITLAEQGDPCALGIKQLRDAIDSLQRERETRGDFSGPISPTSLPMHSRLFIAGGIDDINLRFSKKYPTPQAIIKKNINDYHNIIFSAIKKANKKEIFISIDYQAYYDPALESITGMKFPDFVTSMKKYNSDSFLQWLNRHYGE